MSWQDFRGEMVVGTASLTGASVAGVVVGTIGGVLTPLGGALLGGSFIGGALAGYLVIRLTGLIDEKKHPTAAKAIQIVAAIIGGCITAGLTAIGIGVTLLSTATLIVSAQVIALAIPITIGAILAMLLLGVFAAIIHTKVANFLNLQSAQHPI